MQSLLNTCLFVFIDAHWTTYVTNKISGPIKKNKPLKTHLDYLDRIHSKLLSITTVAIKVHVILRSFVVLTWMCDTIYLV